MQVEAGVRLKVGMQERQWATVVAQVSQGLVQTQVLPLRTFPEMQLVQVVSVPEQRRQGLVQGVQV